MPEETFIGSNRSTFVGRDREIAELSAGLDDAQRGHGRFFLISGEPGIGKSSLANQLAQMAASSSIAVLRATCWEGLGAPAYWPFIQLIRTTFEADYYDPEACFPLASNAISADVSAEIALLVPELEPPTATGIRPTSETPQAEEQARFRLFDAVAATLRHVASFKPLMIIVEDLHEADEPSLSMLQFVVRQFKGSRVLVLATYRDFEMKRAPGRARLIGDLLREGTEVPLFGLSRQDTGRMIEARTGAPASPRILSDIHQATAGNPLFIDGLVRVLWADGLLNNASRVNLANFRVPNGVREAIRRWVDSLSNRSALVAAAAIGQQFDLRCLQLVVEHQAYLLLDTLREAAELGILLSVSNGVYRFSHALIRNALIDELSAAERASLHLRIGEVLEELYQSQLEAHVTELAYHFRQAGDGDKAIDYSIRAGEAARAVFAYEEAAAHWHAALEMMERHSDHSEARAELCQRMGALMHHVDQNAAAHHLEQALRVYENLGRWEKAAEVHAALGVLFSTTLDASIDVRRALSHYRRGEDALRKLKGGPASALYARISHGIAAAAARTMQIKEGLETSASAMEIAERLGDEPLWISAAVQRGLHLVYAGQLTAAYALLEAAWERAEALNDPAISFFASVTGGGAHELVLDPREALPWYQREFASTRTAKAPYQRAFCSGLMGQALLEMGEIAEGRPLLEQSSGKMTFKGLMLFADGQLERADQCWTEAQEPFHRTGGRLEAYAYTRYQVRVRRMLGKRESVLAILKEAFALLSREPIPFVEMSARPAMALFHAEVGQYEEAERQLSRCREIIAAGENWYGYAGVSAQAEAVLAASQGRTDEAERDFGQAVEIFRRYHMPFDEAETFRYWGRALITAGHSVHGVEQLDRAIEVYRRIGAGSPWIERIDADKHEWLSGAPMLTDRNERTEIVPSPVAGLIASNAIFRKEGDYWTLSWAASDFRLNHRKGLHYIAYLLRHPGREFAAQELVFAIEGGPGVPISTTLANEQSRTIARDLGDSGVRLDVQAKGQYRRRLAELREDLAEAERMNDIGRIERSRAEMEFIESEIAGAVGLSGRDRKATSHSERARLSVTKAIRSAILRIQRVNRDLGRHLGVSIRTGYLCVYRPERPVVWRL